MASKKIKYTPSFEFELREGWELAEPEPRIVGPNDSFIGVQTKDVITPSDYQHPHQPHWSGANVDHPVLGRKRFIVREKFIPKITDVIEVSDDKKTWVKRVYIKSDKTGVICFATATNFNSVKCGQQTTHWKYARSCTKRKR